MQCNRSCAFTHILSYLILLHWITYISEVSGFNVDVISALYKYGRENSSFGFSLQGYSHVSGEKGLIIGAPKDGLNGGVFWCSLSSSTCSQIDVRVEELSRLDRTLNNALFGYSLASVDTNKPSIVSICAPRLTWSTASGLYVTGGCFELDRGLQNPQLHSGSVVFCTNIRDSDKYIDLRHCLLGATVGYHSSSPNTLFMGGPYFHFAKGMGALLDTISSRPTSTSINGLPSNAQVGTSMDISDRIYAPIPGSKNSKAVYVAYGGPGVPVAGTDSENFGTGMVVVYATSKESGQITLPAVLTLHGQVFGSRFGHSLVLVDINGDGWEDLIVGAPYQFAEATEGGKQKFGAVYVFLNQQYRFQHPVDHTSDEKPFGFAYVETYQIILPPDHNCGDSVISGFGATISELGDINHDGYQDFAVGAPYEKNGGAVFIYHGTETGKIGPPTQIICASSLQSPRRLEGFGFAVGLKGADLDNNGYPDLAIGAAMSSSAVVLRTRPVLKFEAQMTLLDGSTVITTPLADLPDCTLEAQALSGYKAEVVRCLEVKLFMSYSSIDGLECQPSKQYPVSVILKANPTIMWLTEGWAQPEDNPRNINTDNSNKCEPTGTNSFIPPSVEKFQETYSSAGVSFLGEKTPLDSLGEIEPFFTRNSSAAYSTLDTPGGYLKLQASAVCRSLEALHRKERPNSQELQKAIPVKLVLRDINLLDQTQPLRIGVKWIAEMPKPFPSADRIDDYPIADPRENSQQLKLTFENPCSERLCCAHIQVKYDVKVTRDKYGPVVYVGDDKAQTIEVSAHVLNIGGDPAYVTSLISNFPSNLLELDPSLQESRLIRSDAAICHLSNQLLPGKSTKCTIRWLVVGHQLTVQMAQFFVNSTIVMGSTAPIQVDGDLNNQLKVNIKMTVNVSVAGSIEPNTVYFSGNVSDGISSMTAENQIGDARLLASFTVRNLRKHSLIPASRLIIDWPYEITGSKNEPHGKYMLYLLEPPTVVQMLLPIPGETVENETSVICDSRALDKLVNPHNFRVFPWMRRSRDSKPVRTGPVDLPYGHPKSYPDLSEEMVLEPVPDSLSDSKPRQMTTLSCYNGRLRCIPITCDLGRLSYKAGPITLEFVARLWDNTMREEFRKVFLTKLHLTATWRADVKYGIDLGDSDHALDVVELDIFNNLEPKPITPKYMALYIGLAIFGGLLLLAVLFIILYKAGFFKRRYFPRRERVPAPGN